MSGYRRTHAQRQPTTQPDKTDVVTYLRVSTPRQMLTATDIDRDGLSIATQREACQEKAKQYRKVVIREFVEPGKSAKSIAGRPVFRELMTYVDANPTISMVVVYSFSRVFRNLHDFVTTREHFKQRGIRLVSSKEDYGVGFHAEAMEVMTATFDETQIKQSGADIRTKMGHKARNGGTIGTAPIGYLNSRVTVDGRQVAGVILDPERAPLVRLAYELYATGDYTFEALTETMEEHGLTARPTNRWPNARPLGANSVIRILGDPYYAGFTYYEGELYQGRHEAIVSQALFDRVQDVLDARSQPGKRERVLLHYLKGQLWCDRCLKAGRSSRLIYTEAKGNGGTYCYFFCRGRQRGECDLPYLPVLLVENKLIDYYGNLQLNDEFRDEYNQAVTEALADQQAATRRLTDNLRRERQRLSAQEDNLIDALADGRLPAGKIHERITAIQRKQRLLDERQADGQRELETSAALLRAALDLCQEPHQLYRHAPDGARAQLNRAFFTALYIDEHGDVGEAPLTEPFVELQSIHQHWLAIRAERASTRPTIPDTARSQRIPRNEQQRSVIHEALLRNRLSDPNPGVELARGSSKAVMVEYSRLELLTSSMPWKRSTG